ncbi:MAG TPA: HAD-IIIA family hydrolase [Planctomycetota bacterium]|nr:HAD-IIIA family hydrolase [Planctomycetota bacterium]
MSEAPRSERRAAVFFDRDGTLNREIEGALSRPEQLELLPGAVEAVARVNASGLVAVLLTNQSAIARGWMTHFDLERVHLDLSQRLAAGGARLDGLLACPHLDTEGFAPYHRACACRKPGSGMFRIASMRWNLDLAASWVIGDALRDLAGGAVLGVRGILVRSGKGEREALRIDELPQAARPFAVVPNVLQAVELALANPEVAQGR